MAVPGYTVPIHSSLTSPLLMGGVPRQLAILNATIAAAVVFGLHSLYIIPISVLIHVAAVILAKKDPYFFQIAVRHMRLKSFYKV